MPSKYGKDTFKKVTIRSNETTPFEVFNGAGTALASVNSSGNLSVAGTQTFTGGATFTAAATFNNTVALNGNTTVATAKTLAVTDADKLTVGGLIVPQHFYITFNIPAGAAAGDYDGNIPVPDAAVLVSVTERHQTAGNDAGSVTLMVKKTPSGTAKASGTDCLSAGISLKATADTNQTGTLHGTPANYTFAAGDAASLVLTGTPTAVDGVSVTCKFRRA